MQSVVLLGEAGKIFDSPTQMWCMIGFGATATIGAIYLSYEAVQERFATSREHRKHIPLAPQLIGCLVLAAWSLVRPIAFGRAPNAGDIAGAIGALIGAVLTVVVVRWLNK